MIDESEQTRRVDERLGRLAGKTAIVPSAAAGFGAGIARKFAAEGASVMIADLNLEAAKALADELGQLAHRVDVSNAESVEELADVALAAFGRLEILVNN